jgi:predicted DNA-binding protein
MHTEQVAKNQQFNLRLDADDKERLEVLSKHYAAPAATVIRMLVKRDFDAVARANGTIEPSKT